MVLSWKHCMPPGVPAAVIIWLRSNAQTLEPANVTPFVNMLKLM